MIHESAIFGILFMGAAIYLYWTSGRHESRPDYFLLSMLFAIGVVLTIVNMPMPLGGTSTGISPEMMSVITSQ